MPLTVGQISDKISELRSKIAIQEGVALYLEANFKSSDAGNSEMHFTRNDHARVPEAHIDRYIEDAAEHLSVLRAELHQWESMPVQDPTEAKTPKRKRKPRGTARQRQDNAASGQD